MGPTFLLPYPMLILPVNLPGAKESLAGLRGNQKGKKSKKEVKICIEMNENENTTTQNRWDTVKAVLRGRFIAIRHTSGNKKKVK